MAHQAQVLWSACQALYRSIKAGCPGVPWKDQIRPLEPEVTAVTKAAGRLHNINVYYFFNFYKHKTIIIKITDRMK